MASNQIQLKGGFRHEEAIGSGAIKPGMLLEVTSAGLFLAHNSEGANAERIVAVEDALQGKTVSDAYTTGTLVSAHVVDPGAEVQMLIQAGQNISVGDLLISGGDGTLIKNGEEASGTTVAQIIAVATEACDLSDSDSVDTLAAVRMV